MDGLIKIARTEGPAQLWRGTDLSLAVCVPAIAVYFPLYEHALQHLQSAGNDCCHTPLCAPVAILMLGIWLLSGIAFLFNEDFLFLLMHCCLRHMSLCEGCKQGSRTHVLCAHSCA